MDPGVAKFLDDMARERVAADEACKAERAALLPLLRERGIQHIEAQYDGYGDSGNVSDIALTPEDATLDDLQSRVSDLVWDVAYGLHPGFEINDGGEGTLTWDVVADRIDVDHANFYTGRDEFLHEDV